MKEIDKNTQAIYSAVKKKYQRRRLLSVIALMAGCVVALLTVIFIFIDTGLGSLIWNNYHYWAAGLGAVLITMGAVFLASSISALKDIEKTVDRLNPDERQEAISQRAKANTLKIYTFFIFPVFFIAASILFMLGLINFVAWLIIIASYIALIVTWAFVRRFIYNRF